MSANKLFPFMIKGGIAPSDYDNTTTQGYYNVRGTSSSKVETDWGTLLVIQSFSSNIIQVKYSLNVSGVAMRQKLTSGWTAWARIDNFGYNSLEELAAVLKPLL